MRLKDDGDAPDGIDLDGDVHMIKDGDDEVEEDEEEEDEEEEDKEQEDEDEEEDKDEVDGKEPQTLGQGVMVNQSADNVDTIVEDQPIVLPEQGQKMWEHNQWPHSPECRTWPWTPETHPFSKLEHLGLVRPPKPRSVVPTLREVDDAWNTSDVDVALQIGRLSQCPRHPALQCPSPQCPSPWGAPGCLCRPGMSQSLRSRGGDGCCVWVRVGFLSCLVRLF